MTTVNDLKFKKAERLFVKGNFHPLILNILGLTLEEAQNMGFKTRVAFVLPHWTADIILLRRQNHFFHLQMEKRGFSRRRSCDNGVCTTPVKRRVQTPPAIRTSRELVG